MKYQDLKFGTMVKIKPTNQIAQNIINTYGEFFSVTGWKYVIEDSKEYIHLYNKDTKRHLVLCVDDIELEKIE